MTIAAKVSASEVTSILADRYADQYFEARLINLPAYNYDPGVAGSDATLLAGEVPGHRRYLTTFNFTSSDVGA